MSSNTEKYRKIIESIIRARIPDAKIILYGSRARKDDREGSDIDLALDTGKKIDEKVINAIIFAIEDSSLPIRFDVVDFHTLSERMKEEIRKDGVIWNK